MRDLLDRRLVFGGDIIPAYFASAPAIIKPKRKMQTTQIPGSNREVVDMEDAWEPYEQPYEMFVYGEDYDSINELMDEVLMLLNKSGWQTLVDEYDTDHFRLACFEGALDSDNRSTRMGKFSVKFKCRPERFLVSGNIGVNVPTGNSLINPTVYKAKPLIHVEGIAGGTLTIGSTTITFTDIDDYLNVDCDTMNVYRLPSENKNSLMEGDYPVLKSGENIVSFTGGITSVTITPRWFVI